MECSSLQPPPDVMWWHSGGGAENKAPLLSPLLTTLLHFYYTIMWKIKALYCNSSLYSEIIANLSRQLMKSNHDIYTDKDEPGNQYDNHYNHQFWNLGTLVNTAAFNFHFIKRTWPIFPAWHTECQIIKTVKCRHISLWFPWNASQFCCNAGMSCEL